MLKKSFRSCLLYQNFYFLLFLLIVLLSLPLSFAAAPTQPPDQSGPKAEEIQILHDRDNEINSAVQTLSANSDKKVKSKKIDLSGKRSVDQVKSEQKSPFHWSKLAFWRKSSDPSPQAAKTSLAPPDSSQNERDLELEKSIELVKNSAKKREPQNSNRERMSWQEFFTRRSKRTVSEEVTKKRNERLDQFPSLMPEDAQEAITQAKIELKHDFLNSGEHNLDGVIARAIEVHLPAQIAHERVILSERRISKAFRDFFSDAELSKTLKDGTLSSGPFKSSSWRAAFKQPLFRGGVLWNTFKMEMANREAAKHELEKTVSDLVAAVSSAYFEYERAWNVLGDKQNLFSETKKLKDLSDEKAKANLISEIEKLNIDSLFSQVQYDLETARQDLEIAKLELQKVLELDLSDPVSVKPVYQLENLNISEVGIAPAASTDNSPKGTGETLTDLPAASVNVEGKGIDQYIDLAYAHRPDLQVEASKLRSARLTHKISAGKLLPEADLIVEFGKLGEVFVTGPGGPTAHDPNVLGRSKPTLKNEWRIGTELSWNLSGNTVKYSYDHDQRAPSVSQFEGLQGPIIDTKTASVSLLDNLNSISELKETKIAVLEQVVQLEKAERDVIREVKETYYNYNKALIQVESTHKRMKYRERLMQLAKHRLDNNEIQISEYLQTGIDYVDERMHIHKALSDFYSSKANLNRAIGIRNYLHVES